MECAFNCRVESNFPKKGIISPFLLHFQFIFVLISRLGSCNNKYDQNKLLFFLLLPLFSLDLLFSALFYRSPLISGMISLSFPPSFQFYFFQFLLSVIYFVGYFHGFFLHFFILQVLFFFTMIKAFFLQIVDVTIMYLISFRKPRFYFGKIWFLSYVIFMQFCG